MFEEQNYKIVITNINSGEKAGLLANAIIENKLAACVNIIPSIQSIYWWEGKIQKDSEYLMLIKTSDNLLEKLENFILENHTYETPEIISLNLDFISEKYKNWLNSVLN